jgi:hypothetical protein
VADTNLAIGVGDEGDEIGCGHLRLDERLRSPERAEALGIPERRHVEIEGQQAPIVVPRRPRRCRADHLWSRRIAPLDKHRRG